MPSSTPTTPTEPQDPRGGKGRPTPSRKEREAANRRPLVPSDRKLAVRQDREAARARRDREYQALKTGDERYLPLRDKGPERRWVRDYVDARFNVGEWFLPISLLGVIAMLASGSSPLASVIVLVVLYIGVFAAVIDAWLLSRRLMRGLTATFGADRLPRGYRMYGISRAFQIRRLRLPKPTVRRGEFPS